MKTYTRYFNGLLLLALLMVSAGIPAQAARSMKESLHSTFDCATATGIPTSECEALVALYSATGGDNWTNNTDWLQTTTPCTWYGVTCEAEHVTWIRLHSNQLSGAIPGAIGDFSELQVLALNNNQINAIPPDISNLTALRSLTLGQNRLSGAIPPQIWTLTTLTQLWLSDNQLNGAIPPEIGNLTELRDLRMEKNLLTGVIPAEIGTLTALTLIDLSYNQLSGALPPQIGNLTALRTLWLSRNQFSGPIPAEIWTLTGLYGLDLYSNQLSGTLPAAIGNMTSLTSLWLSGNQLSGSIPPEIGNLIWLRYLSLGGNQFSGAVPAQIGNLTALTDLDLYSNQLTSIPPQIGNLTALTWLRLENNQFSTLPSQTAALTALKYFWVDRNPLTGEMPEFLTTLTQLNRFTFYDTDWCVPPAGVVYTWLSGIPNLLGTGLVCGMELGTLSGNVTLPGTSPAAGVQVNLYRSQWPWQYIGTTYTAVNGHYQFADLGQGLGIDYRVQFVDPTHQLAPQYYDSKPTLRTATLITITPGVARTGIDAMLAVPLLPLASVDAGDGSVVYAPDGTAQVAMPASAPRDITVTRTITCSSGAPTDVMLKLTPPGTLYPMTPIGADQYRGTVPAAALTNNAVLSILATCGTIATETTVGYIALYDPSGIVTDARTGQPVQGATVTLHQVPGWEPKTGSDDDRLNTCQSNDSKAPGDPWSQPAPTELGIIANADVTTISPRLPYQHTTAAGYYGWDVSMGCWYVTVAAEGYAPLVSPVVGVPPEVTDLHLALTPTGGFTVFLPLVLRNQ